MGGENPEGPRGSQESRPGAGPGRCGRRLQRLLARPWREDDRHPADVSRRGSFRRPGAGAYGDRQAALRRAVRPLGGSACRTGGPKPARALHQGLQFGPADEPRGIQQLRRDLPDSDACRDAQRDGQRSSHRPAGRQGPRAGKRAPLEGRLARPVGRRHTGGDDQELHEAYELPWVRAEHGAGGALHQGTRRTLCGTSTRWRIWNRSRSPGPSRSR